MEIQKTRQHGIFDYYQEYMGKNFGAFWILAAILIIYQYPLGQVTSFFTLRVLYLFVSVLRAGKIPYISHILL